ncbi:MAG: type I methionyl aminopeptidase [Candidatus Gracilibacteria bacterium]|nr:type I methionyl aminopeptidase [Candidatus Gracilibacteria bacterium]
MTNYKPKTQRELDRMRKNAQIHKIVFEEIKKIALPGVSAWEIDQLCLNICNRHNVLPGFKGVYGFPANICISINDVVVHGIPTKKMIFKSGDVVKFDFGVKDKELGLNTDAAFTMIIGENKDREVERFLRVNEEALYKGISKAIPGNRIGDIGHAIQSHVEAAGFHIIKDLTGHRIGYKLHEKPYVPNYGKPGTGELLIAGMTLAIEPIVGFSSGKMIDKDGKWEIYVADGSLGSQFEHTILVRDGYPEIII